jgi:hypothetical protein
MHKGLLFFALLPFTAALAADPQASAPLWKKLDKKDIQIDDLAHSFFFHSASPEMLKSIISEQGIDRLKPEIAQHRRDMTDLTKVAPNLRRLCTDLQGAKTGREFAAVLVEAERRGQNEMEQAARRIISKLDAGDREALEHYLDTEYRNGAGRSRLDYEAMFASRPFPSADSNLLAQRTCNSAQEVEARIAP